MAQFDVYLLDGGYVVDVQSDLVAAFEVRLVVPLIPMGELPGGHPRLVPELAVRGQKHLLATPLAAAVPLRQLTEPVGSLARHELVIKAALDFLVRGF